MAATYAMRIFSSDFIDTSRELRESKIDGKSVDFMATVGTEIHALSSATKPLCTWAARDVIQDCRESCGGHGYLKGKFFNFSLVLN